MGRRTIRRVAGSRFGLTTNTRPAGVTKAGVRGGGARLGGSRRGVGAGAGAAGRGSNRGGFNAGWGRNHRRDKGHHHDFWLGYGLWCGFGYQGGHSSNYWYNHCLYHPYRFLYWSYPDYYYCDVPVYSYPPDSVVTYDEIDRDGEAEEEVAEAADSAEREAPTVESIIANHVKLGDFYFREGKYDQAAESYLRALAYAPEDASIHFILADALFGMGDYHYAAFIIRKAMRVDPEMANAKADKRDFYKDPKEFDKQLETLRSYLVEKPYDSAAHLVLGYNLYFSAHQDLAKKAFTRVLEISPDDQAAQLFLAAMEKPEEKADAQPSEEKPAEKPAKKD